MMTGAGRVFRQAKRIVFVQKNRQRCADGSALTHVAGRDALPVCAVSVIAHDTHSGVHLVSVRGLRGRDGIHARREALQNVKELLRVGNDAGELGREVDELAAPDVLLCLCLVFRAEQSGQRGGNIFSGELGDTA